MKKGFIAGAWDLLHPGHLIALRFCKANCDFLVVGLQVNPGIERGSKHKPIQTVYERFVQLNNCRWIDAIIPYETELDLLNILSTTDINVRFLDEDYKTRAELITGKDVIPIIYLSRKHTFSSSELRERVKRAK